MCFEYLVSLMEVHALQEGTSLVARIILISDDFSLYYVSEPLEVAHDFPVVPLPRHLPHEQSHINLGAS